MSKTVQIEDNIHTAIKKIKKDSGKPVQFIIDELLRLALRMKKIDIK